MNPGIYLMTNDEYHQSPGISKSGLDLIAKTPLHYKYNQDHQEEKDDDTPAHFLIGSALHAAVLEPDLFRQTYLPDIKIDRRTKTGKKIHAEFLESAKDKTILTSTQWKQVNNMTKAVLHNQEASDLLQNGEPEKSVFWNDPDIDILCRCRPDWWRNDEILIDVKTTNSAAPDAFRYAIGRYRYDIQAAFYIDGCNAIFPEKPISHFVFIAVEKSPPFAVAIYSLDAQSIIAGRDVYKKDLATYKECIENNRFPGYTGFNEIESPRIRRY